MKRILQSLFTGGLLVAGVAVQAATATISPLLTFGGGDGWLSPGEGGYTFLGTGNLERGLAYGNGSLYLVSRNGGVNIRILDALTGADVGALATGSGVISGGTFTVNMVGVGGDGAIYVGNLSTAAATPFRVYRWADNAATPTVAYSATSTLPRTGDTFDVIGSGAGTRIVASGTGSSGFLSLDPTAGTGTAVSVSGTAAGDYRLGLTFTDSDTVIGTQGGLFRVTDYAGSVGILLGSPATLSASERLMDYAVVGGVPLLATVDTVSSLLRVYDATDPVSLVLLGSANNTTGTLTANGNGAGAVAFGNISGDTAILYAMSANQGIQAFVVTVPEPSTVALLGLGGLVVAGGWLRGRRR